MKKTSFLFSVLALVLTLPVSGQFLFVDVPENGKNCVKEIFYDDIPWTPPGEPTSAQHFKWDGSNWLNLSYSYYEYNSNGTLHAEVISDENNDLWYRIEFEYNAQDLVTMKTVYRYSESTGWNYKYRSTYAYDAQGRRVEKLFQHYGLGQWYNSSLRSQTYDAHGFETMRLTREWNTQTSFWDTTYAEDYAFTYDSNGYPHESIHRQYWGGWSNVEKRKYILNGSNEVVEIQIDSRNGAMYAPQEFVKNIVWKPSAIREYESAEYYYFNGVTYDPSYATEHFPTSCARDNNMTVYVWDGTNFIANSTSNRAYDAGGTYTGFHFVNIDTATGIGTTTVLELGTPTYDGSGAIQEYLFQEADSLGVLQNVNKSIYAFNVGMHEELAEGTLSLYPSLASSFVNLEHPNLDVTAVYLFNAVGQLIQEFDANLQKFSVENLPIGVYYVSVLTSDGKRLQEKFAVRGK